MSRSRKEEKVEQITPCDSERPDDRDNACNKSKSPSNLYQLQENQKPNAEQWKSGGIEKIESQGPAPLGIQATGTPEHMRGAATKDMFDLIERVQCSRIDDQRCVLPAYFSQIPF